MEAKAKLLGHAIHPMLITIPVGLLSFVWVFDIVRLVNGNALWAAQTSFWLTVAGVLGALLAAVFGFIDWFWAVPSGTRARRVGLTHLALNLLVVAAFVVAFAFRVERHIQNPGYAPFALDLVGFGLLLVSGWLGAELVEQHGVGINEVAHLNAPSSLDTTRLMRKRQEQPALREREEQTKLPGPTEPQPA